MIVPVEAHGRRKTSTNPRTPNPEISVAAVAGIEKRWS